MKESMLFVEQKYTFLKKAIQNQKCPTHSFREVRCTSAHIRIAN